MGIPATRSLLMGWVHQVRRWVGYIREAGIPEGDDGHRSGRYASYWNAFLLKAIFTTTSLFFSVCKSCLVRYLDIEKNNKCPRCELVIHQSHPLNYISHDRTMQDIVYKLVPKLQESKNIKIDLFAKWNAWVFPVVNGKFSKCIFYTAS